MELQVWTFMSSTTLETILVSRSQFQSRGTNYFSTERHEIAWHGFVYMDGVSSGEPSIRRFAEEIGTNLAAAAAKLRGVYFVSVRDRATDHAFAFVDSSALYHAYLSPHFVGTSFLDMVSLEGLTTEDLDPEAVVEFLEFGCIYSGKTFFDRIRKIDADAIAESRPDGSTAFIPKPIPDLSEPAQCCFEDVLRSFAQSITNQKVSLDLTGGIDSRLLAVMLSYFGLPFELALSGNAEHEDVEIARNVAKGLDRDFFLTPHDPHKTDWTELFSISDGLFDLGRSDRSAQLQRDRAARGVTLAVSGAGGELFKDFWWLQDFPFYTRKASNLERLYSMRFAAAKQKTVLVGPRYQDAADGLRKRMLGTLGTLVEPTNTETYDRVYYGLKMREFAGRFLTNSSKFLGVHAPYLDRESVRIGYNLDRSERFFNRFHRRIMTKYSPKIAKMATTEGGMGCSAATFELSKDLIKYVSDRSSRLKRKLKQRRGAALKPSQGPDHPQLSHILTEFGRARNTVERLQNHGVLNQDASNDRLLSNSMGSLIALDMLIECLESKSGADSDSKFSAFQPA
jgi:hypothetical protein